MTLQPYTGFDPHEDEFEGVEPAPLHDEDLVKVRPPIRTNIDIDRAWHLKRVRGLTWNQVGRWLAIEEGRRMPYHGTSVRIAATSAVRITK